MDPGDKSAGMPLCPGDEITAVAVNGMAVSAGLGIGDPLSLPEADRCPFGRKGIGGPDGRHKGLAVGLVIGSDDLFGHLLSDLYILPVSRPAAAAEDTGELGVEVCIDPVQFLLCVMGTALLHRFPASTV